MYPVLFRLIYCCGLRCGEACKIRVDDINFLNCVIKIRDAKNYNNREVFISKNMMNLIVKYIEKLKKIYSSNMIFLFPNTSLNKHISPADVSENFYKMIKILNIGNKDFHPVVHTLRHYVTLLIDFFFF